MKKTKKSAIKLNPLWKEIKTDGSHRLIIMKDKYWEMLMNIRGFKTKSK